MENRRQPALDSPGPLATAGRAPQVAHRLLGSADRLAFARQVLRSEAAAIETVAELLGDTFIQAADCIHACRGSAVVTGMGKAGLIARKISATLASTGTRSHFLHPAEAVHGDLGRLHSDDVAVLLSQSGETEEVVRLTPILADLGLSMIAVTASSSSTLGRSATITISLGEMDEACSLGLAPTTTTTAMLAVGDALALTVSRMREFTRDDFARFHPAGNLGRRLTKVEGLMRPIQICRLAPGAQTVRTVLVDNSLPGRRTGAVMITDADGVLIGIFTDSDLARLFERRRESALDRPIAEVMTAGPRSVPIGTELTEAAAIMTEQKLSELPVVDARRRPVGLLDVTDLGNHWARVFARPQTSSSVPAPLAPHIFASARPRS